MKPPGFFDVAVLFPGCVFLAAIGEDHQRIPIGKAIEAEAGAGFEFVELAVGVDEFEGGLGSEIGDVAKEADLADEDLVPFRVGAAEFAQVVEARSFVMKSQSHHFAGSATMDGEQKDFKRRLHF